MKKLGMRLWILAIALALAIPAMITSPASSKFFVFALIIGIFYVIGSVKSKPGKIILVLVLLGTVGFVILNSQVEGALVSSVGINSSIYEAGLRDGEIITSVNGEPVIDVGPLT